MFRDAVHVVVVVVGFFCRPRLFLNHTVNRLGLMLSAHGDTHHTHRGEVSHCADALEDIFVPPLPGGGGERKLEKGQGDGRAGTAGEEEGRARGEDLGPCRWSCILRSSFLFFFFFFPVQEGTIPEPTLALLLPCKAGQKEAKSKAFLPLALPSCSPSSLPVWSIYLPAGFLCRRRDSAGEEGLAFAGPREEEQEEKALPLAPIAMVI